MLGVSVTDSFVSFIHVEMNGCVPYLGSRDLRSSLFSVLRTARLFPSGYRDLTDRTKPGVVSF